MPAPIEDYALLGDLRTAALVSRSGSVDWMCVPRFDSPACFAALVGTPADGRFLLTVDGDAERVERSYRDETLVLETDYECEHGAVTVVDAMGRGSAEPELVRLVIGRRGRVAMRMELNVRFDYGRSRPWIERRGPEELTAVCGPDAVRLSTPVEVRDDGAVQTARFVVEEGETVPFTLTWFAAHGPEPAHLDPVHTVADTERWWREWSSRCTHEGRWRAAVQRSLITLKALTYAPTGGIVAAPTTSLPEQLRGTRNWDYRYCWLRDAAFTIAALRDGGYREEALAWRQWLLRAVAGEPEAMQIVYGVAGERRLTEIDADWLPGYEGARPVRIGNAASEQFQLDVYGEVADAQLRLAGEVGFHPAQQRVAARVLEFLESAWRRPDESIWEVRGPRRHFTYSKVMAWVAFDRAVWAAETMGLEGPVDRWRAVRDEIHGEVCRKAFDAQRNTFVQSYGSRQVDASLLKIPLVGFLPADDPRVAGTVQAIREDLAMGDGLLRRYSRQPEGSLDGIRDDEGAFLACSFWLVDNLTLMGRVDEARDLFEQLLDRANDLGLLAEEHDPAAGRLTGNFPQALSHIALVNSATLLARTGDPVAAAARPPHAGDVAPRWDGSPRGARPSRATAPGGRTGTPRARSDER
jgi:GH15 family glucan-1,4-alpha-glucosidase